MADTDAASDRVTAALAEAIRHGELGDTNVGMPAGWVLVGTYHGEDGTLRTALLTNSGASLHETLGLLDLGQIAWREQGRRWTHGDE